MVAGVWWWIVFPVALVVITFIGLFLLAVSMNEYIDPRSRLSRMGGAADGGRPCTPSSRQPGRAGAAVDATCAPTTRRSYFGVEREVRAVDDISLQVGRNEIYGLAGESSSGKTTLIKTIAGAIRPPLNVRRRLGALQLP